MDETTFKILDILASDLGLPTSIRALAERIQRKYGSGYYANVYKKLQQLTHENTVKIQVAGKTSLVDLNFSEYITVDLLSEMEIKKKLELLKGRPELEMLFLELDTYLRGFIFVRSISIINAEKNLKLNRVELLIVVRGHGTSLFPEESEVKSLHAMLQTLQSIHNLKLDYLVITDQKLIDSLATTHEVNPIREMMPNRTTAFYGPQNFWNTIRVGIDAGLQLRVLEGETVPAKIPEADLAFNLAKAGYKEMGATVVGGKNICAEYIVTAVMAQGNARRVEAVPVILAKQSDRVNYDILLFLAQKYKLSEMLLGLLKAYTEVVSDKRAKDAVEIMDLLKIKEAPVDKKSILEKMKLYNAIG